jgi:hypothetical protein
VPRTRVRPLPGAGFRGRGAISLTCGSCGPRNPDRAQFCANQQCGAYLGWDGQFTTSAPDPTGPTQRRDHHCAKPSPTTTTATPPPPKEPGPLASEFCIPYDPARLDIRDLDTEWELFQGSSQILLLANAADADAALAEAKRYTKVCFLNSDNPDGHTVTLWRGRLDDESTITGEACESYDPTILRVAETEFGWELFDENRALRGRPLAGCPLLALRASRR